MIREDVAAAPATTWRARPAAAAFPRWAYVTLWLVAVLPRVIVAGPYLRYGITLSDMLQYDMLARSIEAGRGYRWYSAADVERFSSYLSLMVDVSQIHAPEEGLATTFRAPGYPVALAAVYALFPREQHLPAARLAQAALLATIAPLAAACAVASGARRRWAGLAGLGAALYPILLYYPVGLASENLFVPLTGLAFLATLRARRRPGWRPVVLAGLALGAAMLTRGTLAPFVLLAGLWLAWPARTAARFFVVATSVASGTHRTTEVVTANRRAALLCAVAFGLCLPWSLRNTRLMGAPSFVETTIGYNLYVGNHPGGNGGFVQEIAIAPMLILDDAERDRVTRTAALGFIRDDPAEALRRIARRAAFFVGVEDRELLFFYNVGLFGAIPPGTRWALYGLLVLPWLLVAALGWAGLVVAPRRDAAWLAALLVAGLALPPLLVLAEPRFHLPLVPVLLGFAVVAVQERRAVRAALRGRAGRKRALALWAGLAALALLWVWGYAMNWDRLLAIMGPGGHRMMLPY